MQTTPMKPLSFRESLVFSSGALGSNVVYAFLNFAAGLYLGHYPAVPAWAIGILSQERSFVGAFVQPVVGAISDRTRTPIGRRRPFFIIGVALTAAALLFLSGFPPLIPMLIVLTVLAFFLNVAVDPYTALMADIVPPSQRGRIGALMAITNMIGQISMALGGLFLWDQSPQLVFVLVAVVLVIGFGVTTVGVKEPEAAPAPREPVHFDAVAYARGILAQRELAKYVGGAVFFWLGTGGVLPYLSRFAVNELHTSEGDSFLLFLPALIGTIASAVIAGYAADRLGKKRVLAAGVAAYAVFVLIGSQVQDVPQALVAMAFIGLANGVWTALSMPLMVDLVPPDRAAEMTGLGSGVWSLTQPVGSLFAGFLITIFANYRASFIGTAVLVFVSFLLLLTVRAPRATAPAASLRTDVAPA
jgi:maltose/moltooligosaccharide transporter